MKKIQIAVMALLAVAFITTTNNTSAQTKKMDKQLEKQLDKMYKEKIKEYNREGWKLAGGSRTLEVALLEHYQKTADNKNKELVGDVSKCKSINICRQSALNNAQNNYASRASANIKGRIASLLRANAEIPQEEIDKMMGAFEKSIQADVSGVMTESYSIVKDNGDGTKSFQTIFIVNEEEAAATRMRAMQRSLKETKVTIDEAEEISKFVQEGFPLE
jgi:hypothetical protein